jgi:hypothetical protein
VRAAFRSVLCHSELPVDRHAEHVAATRTATRQPPLSHTLHPTLARDPLTECTYASVVPLIAMTST